eukprot:4109718-Pleurochrysis_carterae.AAC.2
MRVSSACQQYFTSVVMHAEAVHTRFVRPAWRAESPPPDRRRCLSQRSAATKWSQSRVRACASACEPVSEPGNRCCHGLGCLAKRQTDCDLDVRAGPTTRDPATRGNLSIGPCSAAMSGRLAIAGDAVGSVEEGAVRLRMPTPTQTEMGATAATDSRELPRRRRGWLAQNDIRR